MDIESVDPELREATEKLPAFDASRPLMRGVARIATQFMPMKAVTGVKVRRIRDDRARAYVYTPDQVRTDGALLWIHGGGFVIGTAKQDHALCAEVSTRLGMIVVSADYRLAPDHPFPAPLDDVTAVWAWLQSNAHALGVDPARIVIGGESAGGGLAASLVQRLTRGAPPHPIAQWLFCPMLDDRTAANIDLDSVDHFIWGNKLNRFGWTSYLAQEPGLPTAPEFAVAARIPDVLSQPPTWISTGDIELFYEEDVAYADRLRAAGIPVELVIVPGAPHGFENWARKTPPARRLIDSGITWLGNQLEVTIGSSSR